ncbi:sugar transferase [Actinomadura oligospora]|uniref:sugar transferase n=1 Tax=Actinomadura oligospora TaxID=111804 RepID=UPI0004BCDEC7|nr:sugar transferase [Actinomadura oligospora]
MTVIDGVNSGTGGRVATRATWFARYVHLLVVLDLACAATAGVAGFALRFSGWDESGRWPDILLAIGLPLVWVPWLSFAGCYDHRFLGSGAAEYRKVLNAGITLTAAVAILSYATKAEVARGYVLLALPLLVALDVTARRTARSRLHRAREHGDCMRRVVAVGYHDGVADLVRELSLHPHHGMQVVGVCAPEPPGLTVEDVMVLGGFEDVPEVVERCHADAVAVLPCVELNGVRLRRLAWRLEKFRTDLFVSPALLDVAGPRLTIRPVAGFSLLHVDHPELTGPARAAKAAFDRITAALLLIAVAPLLLAVAVAVRTTDPGPAFFQQTRIGRAGRRFRMIKFRTMVTDAERRRVELSARVENGSVLFKLKRDPRVTRIGRVLRRYSIDELPQLFNVVRGEMSLVGPRPPLPEEVERYGQDVYRRLAVKPGLTGLWQVSGRSDLSWDEAVRLDLQYVENWSLLLDLQILWRTVRAVVSGNGAY